MIQAGTLVEKFRYALDNNWGYIWGTAGIKWTKAAQEKKVNYMISQYGKDWQKNADAKSDVYYSSASNGSKWIGHYVADCSGLFVWAFKNSGWSIAHGSNSIYDRYCTDKGKLNDSLKKTILPGTAVFTGDANKHNHIGLYVGNGKCIEASGVSAGVCVSNITAGKWTYYGLLKNVEYTEVPDKQDDIDLPTLKRGDKGAYVTKAQTELAQRGYDLGKCGIDGDFGPATEKAVKQFQKDWGLTQDGVIGPKTWALLTSAPVNNAKYTVTIPGLDLTKAKELCSKFTGATMKEE